MVFLPDIPLLIGIKVLLNLWLIACNLTNIRANQVAWTLLALQQQNNKQYGVRMFSTNNTTTCTKCNGGNTERLQWLFRTTVRDFIGRQVLVDSQLSQNKDDNQEYSRGVPEEQSRKSEFP